MDYFNDLNPYLVRQDPAPAETPDTTPTPAPAPTPNQTPGTPSTPSVTPAPVIDQAYVENILRINVGKLRIPAAMNGGTESLKVLLNRRDEIILFFTIPKPANATYYN